MNNLSHYAQGIDDCLANECLIMGALVDDDLPFVTVLLPMHNEEKVAGNVLEHLMGIDYPFHRLEIVPINDHSTDATGEIVDSFASRFPDTIKPIHRNKGRRGKPSALSAKRCRGKITVIPRLYWRISSDGVP